MVQVLGNGVLSNNGQLDIFLFIYFNIKNKKIKDKGTANYALKKMKL